MIPSTAHQPALEPASDAFRNSVHVCTRDARATHHSSLVTRHSPLATPSIELAGLRIFASREGDRVTGRVDFPYETYDRSSIPIAYRNAPLNAATLQPFNPDLKVVFRIAVVQKWRDLCRENSKATKLDMARRAAEETTAHCSPRTIYVWARRLDTEGPEGLADRYTPAPPAVLALNSKLASDAVLVCAWWSFRIGNLDQVDTPAVFTASRLLRSNMPIADVLAAIDCYYAWPTDRQVYPFKSFPRWVRYDFEKWLFRACVEADYRKGWNSPGTVPLRQPQTIHRSQVPEPRARKRDVADRSTRAALAKLEPLISATLEPCIPSPFVAWLQSLDPRWRRLFLDLARRDCQAVVELTTTIALWWRQVPESIRGPIEMRLAVQPVRLSPAQLASRKVLSLVPHLRSAKADLTNLRASARMAGP